MPPDESAFSPNECKIRAYLLLGQIFLTIGKRITYLLTFFHIVLLEIRVFKAISLIYKDAFCYFINF